MEVGYLAVAEPLMEELAVVRQVFVRLYGTGYARVKVEDAL